MRLIDFEMLIFAGSTSEGIRYNYTIQQLAS